VADAGGLMRSIPGIGAARRGPLGLDPNVRGLSETEVGVYIDGVRSFPAGPLRMDSPLSHLDPSAVASVDVVKGPYALTWGPGNMSAVRVTKRGDDPPRTPLTGSVHTGYDTNLQAVETTGFAMGRQGRWFYSANGAWRTGDDYDSGSDAVTPAGYTSGEGRGRIGVDLSARSTLSVSGGYQEQRDIDYPGRLLNANFFRTGTGQIAYAFSQNQGLLRGLDVQASAQQTLHGMDNEGKPTFEAGRDAEGNVVRPPLRVGVDAEIQTYSGRAAADLRLGSAWDATVGADVLHTYRDARRPFRAVMMDGTRVIPPFYRDATGDPLDRVWPGATLTQEGAFVNASRRAGPLQLSATTRLDFAQADADAPTAVFLENADATPTDLAQNDVMLSGALTVSLPVDAVWTVAGGVGSVARPPDALERYADRIPASKAQTSAEFQGNPFLDPERSTQADLWIEGMGTTWRIRLSGFARRIDDYITLAATDLNPLLPLSPPTVFRYVNGEATFYGAEAGGSVTPLPRVTLRASGSYLWGRDDAFDEPAFGVAPAAGEVALRWSPVLGLPSVRNAFLESTVRFVAEQDRVATTRGESPTDGYTLVGLGGGVRVLNRVQLQLGVENLFDVAYTNHLNATNPFRNDRVPEPGRVVSFDVTVAF
jgi:iron complex outermembrane receptor protein